MTGPGLSLGRIEPGAGPYPAEITVQFHRPAFAIAERYMAVSAFRGQDGIEMPVSEQVGAGCGHQAVSLISLPQRAFVIGTPYLHALVPGLQYRVSGPAAVQYQGVADAYLAQRLRIIFSYGAGQVVHPSVCHPPRQGDSPVRFSPEPSFFDREPQAGRFSADGVSSYDFQVLDVILSFPSAVGGLAVLDIIECLVLASASR